MVWLLGVRATRFYPAGTIVLQRPFFQDLGLDLSDCFEGTSM